VTHLGDLSVRSRSASGTWRKETKAYVCDLEGLILNCLSIQSAVSPFLSGAWLRIAVGIFPAMAKRSLHSLWIGSDLAALIRNRA
jgi:hypothetical protein